MRRDCRGTSLFEYSFTSIYCVTYGNIYDKIHYKDVATIQIGSHIFALNYRSV